MRPQRHEVEGRWYSLGIPASGGNSWQLVRSRRSADGWVLAGMLGRRTSYSTHSRKFVRKSLGFICTELAATARSCSPRPAQSRGCLPRVSGPGCHWRPLGRNSARRNREWPRDAPLGSWPLGTRDGRHIQSPVLGRASGEGEDPDATSPRPSSFALCLPPEWASKTDTAMLDE